MSQDGLERDYLLKMAINSQHSTLSAMYQRYSQCYCYLVWKNSKQTILQVETLTFQKVAMGF